MTTAAFATYLAAAIRNAEAADEAFEAACFAAGFSSRWTPGCEHHPIVKPAHEAKLAAAKAMVVAFETARNGS